VAANICMHAIGSKSRNRIHFISRVRHSSNLIIQAWSGVPKIRKYHKLHKLHKHLQLDKIYQNWFKKIHFLRCLLCSWSVFGVFKVGPKTVMVLSYHSLTKSKGAFTRWNIPWYIWHLGSNIAWCKICFGRKIFCMGHVSQAVHRQLWLKSYL
jgi:hypothetical protein